MFKTSWLTCIAPVLSMAPLVLVQCGGTDATLGGGGSDGGGGDGTMSSSSSGGSGSGGGSGGSSNGGSTSGGSSTGGSGGGTSSSGSSSGTGSSGSGGGSTGSSSGASSGGLDGGTGGDAAACVVPEGGLPCDPGSVPCGMQQTCATPGHFCCISAQGMTACDATGQVCLGRSIHCKEASDCAAGQVCCAELRAGGQPNTVCSANKCTGMGFQVCRSDTECPQGKCIVQMCGTQKVEACVKLPGCTAL